MLPQEAIGERSPWRNRMIEFGVHRGDVPEVSSDLLLLKHAQACSGADGAVIETAGAIEATRVMFLGTPGLHDYADHDSARHRVWPGRGRVTTATCRRLPLRAAEIPPIDNRSALEERMLASAVARTGSVSAPETPTGAARERTEHPVTDRHPPRGPGLRNALRASRRGAFHRGRSRSHPGGRTGSSRRSVHDLSCCSPARGRPGRASCRGGAQETRTRPPTSRCRAWRRGVTR